MADEAQQSEHDRGAARRGADLPAARRVRRAARSSPTTPSYDEADGRLRGVLGRRRPASSSTGSSRGTPSSSGTSRSRSGSSAGSSTSSYNCLDRHVEAGHGDQVAFLWEGEPGDTRTITYAELLDEVAAPPTRSRRSASRRATGSHLPRAWCPSCRWRCSRARGIGAAHSVVFGGFSSDSLRDRINDAEARCSSPATARGGAAASSRSRRSPTRRWPSARRSRRCSCCGAPARTSRWPDGRDVWWHDLVPQQSAECPPEPMDAEDLLYLLYTSGTTGEAQGHHAHDRRLPHPGRVHAQVRVRPAPRHRRLLVRGRLSAGSPATRTSSTARSRTGATSVMYEGTPDHPDKDRFWSDRREVRRHDPLHRAHRDPHVHEVGHRSSPSGTTSRRCGCSARSASRSTRRRGSGTGSTSAASAARSSTRGGRPRPAPS